MLKYLLMLSLINTSVSIEHVYVDSIEYNQVNDDNKKITFNFKSDYSIQHELEVFIDVFDNEGNIYRNYSNKIIVIGDNIANANIKHDHNDGDYFLISVNYKQEEILKNVKIVMRKQEDCYLDKNNLECKRIYKSGYYDGINKDSYTKIIITKNIFDKFLYSNVLNLGNIVLYSESELLNQETYFILKNEIKEYDLPYINEYRFLLETYRKDGYSFRLMEDYYLDIIDFKFSENYFENSIKSKEIYFPFSNEYLEYNCKIIIKSFVNIEINFNVYTGEYLFGDCNNSKYCLKVENYD